MFIGGLIFPGFLTYSVMLPVDEINVILNLQLEISATQRCISVAPYYEERQKWCEENVAKRLTMEALIERIKENYAPEEYKKLKDPHTPKINFQSYCAIFALQERHFLDFH